MAKKLLSLAVVALAIGAYWFLYHGPMSAEHKQVELQLQEVRGKRILITGASSGIGEELAFAYCRLGASVLLTARRGDLLEVVANKCRQLGAERVDYVAADMHDPLERRKVVNEIGIKEVDGHQSQRLNHLILNHALMPMGQWTGAPENVTLLRRMLEVNFVAYVDMTSLCLDMLRETNGSVGVVSSVAGKMPHSYAAAYSANKFALHGFFASLRQELMWAKVDVSITLLVLGLVNTATAVDNAARHFPKVAETVASTAARADDAANFIVRAIVGRKYEAIYPTIAWVLIQAHKLFPSFIEDTMGYKMHLAFN